MSVLAVPTTMVEGDGASVTTGTRGDETLTVTVAIDEPANPVQVSV